MNIYEYDVVIMTHDPSLAIPVQQSLHPIPSRIFHGANYPSFSKLVNDCITSSDKDIVIVCSYKVRPTSKDIEKMLNLIQKGYGIVCLYRFAFFGFHKEFIRRIGFFDERYVNGGYEDCDILRRCMTNNIAYYEDECVPYIKKKSTWNYHSPNSPSKIFFKRKWNEKEHGKVIKCLKDEKYDYYIGENDDRIMFLDKDQSIFLPPSGQFNINEFIDHS